MKRSASCPMPTVERGPLRHLEYDGEPPKSWAVSEDPIEALNDLVRHVGAAIKKRKVKVAAKKRVHRQHQDTKAWSDAKFYTVLVFDTGNQCQAFIDAIKATAHMNVEGDLFLDGRHIANAFGIALPEPEYQLKKHKTDVRRGVNTMSR